MSFTVRVAKTVTEGSTQLTSSNDYPCDVIAKISETVPIATVDSGYLVALDISRLKVFSMISSTALTVKTNSSGAPQETFVLAANTPVVWEEGDAAIFAGDVTQLFLTNAALVASNFRMVAGSAN